MKTWNNENGFPRTCISHFIVARKVRPSFSCFILFEEKIKFHPKANTVSHLLGGERKLSQVLLFFFLFHFQVLAGTFLLQMPNRRKGKRLKKIPFSFSLFLQLVEVPLPPFSLVPTFSSTKFPFAANEMMKSNKNSGDLIFCGQHFSSQHKEAIVMI